MKLVIDLIGFEHGRSYGYEEYVLNILKFLSENRESINVQDIIVVCQTSQISYLKQRLGDILHYYTLDGRSYLKRFYNSFRVPYLLHLTDEDILLYTGNYMPLFGNKGKKILVIHDLLFRHSAYCAQNIGFLIFRLQKYLYVPISLRKAKKVIAISEFTKMEIMESYHIEQQKIDAIYNYFDFDKYGELSLIASEDRLIKERYILSVCSSAKHKNHETLLKAFERFCANEISTKFVIVGALSRSAQRYFDSLQHNVRNRVVFLKHLSNKELGNVYHNASMYVSASWYEGLGMPVVEAMYFGLPTLLSDTIIHREVSLNKAQYFSPMDFKELSRLMMKNINAIRTTNAVLQANLRQKYDEEHTSMKYIEVINSILLK